MLRTLPLLLLLPLVVITARSQDVLISRDNGVPQGYYANAPSFFEESVILTPDGPCTILEVQIYYSGNESKKDTVMICGDPAEGAVPPTAWVWGYNVRASAVVDYNGQPGWRSIDLRALDIRSDGYDRIIVQHWIHKGGPWFTVDSDAQVEPWASFIMDPHQQNSLGGPGRYFLSSNDFLVRILVQYDYPSGNTSEPPPAATLIDVTTTAGLTNSSSDPIGASMAAVADWNGDGLDDVAIGSTRFLNNGDGSFSDVTASMGIDGGNISWGDYDNDGNVDAYLVAGGDNDKLYRNQGDGTFVDVTGASGISNPYPTVTPIWLDFNGDEHLDLFIANGRRTVNSNEVFYPDQLWRNNGDGSFSNVTVQSGIAAGEPSPYYDCWGASACDFNNDGHTDIFVSTYRLAPDLLYRNNGNGTFTEVAAQTGTIGVPTAASGYYGHGMGSDWGDFNNDGWTDLAVGNLGHPDWRGVYSNPSLVFLSNRGVNFDDVHQDLGVKFFEMNAGVAWADMDLDGYLDLWQSQYSYSKEGEGGEPARLSRMYISEGAPSYRLRDRTWTLGSRIHGAWTVSRLDYDADGDIDLLVASPRDGTRLFRNDLARKGRWLALRLTGDAAQGLNAQAFGTRVVVHANGQQFTRTLSTSAAGSRAATHSCELLFGLGNTVSIDSTVLHYPTGITRTLTTLQPDRRYSIAYDGGVSTGVLSDVAPSAWRLVNARYGGGTLYLNSEGLEHPRNVELSLYNALGQHVLQPRRVAITSGAVAVPVHRQLARGMYYLSLRDGTNVVTAKLLVAP